MCVSRAICAILLVLKLSFQNCPIFKQRFGAPLRWRPPPPPPPPPPPRTAGSAGPFVTPLDPHPFFSNKNTRLLFNSVVRQLRD